MDINLWNIFTFGREIPDTSTYRIFTAYVDDSTTVASSDFELERLGYAWMPDNAACYAQQWRFTSEVLDIGLLMSALHSNHEVELPFRFYEGMMDIEGTVGGQPVNGWGFAELLQQYEHPQIDILAPSMDMQWDPVTQPIRWELLNPDDGRPVTYDVALSLDDKASWVTIAEGLPTTEYLWSPTGWPTDSLYWFRLSGYSIDGTLMGSTETDIPFAIVTQSNTPLAEATPSRVFPNPATEKVFIDLTNRPGSTQALLRNTTGQPLIQAAGARLLQWDISRLPAGFYWVEIREEGAVQVQKLAIVR
jgi:hypothetical protein